MAIRQLPKFKVYNPDGVFVASCKYIEDAATLVGSYGEGASIRHGHKKRDTFWIEGTEQCSATESVDVVAEKFEHWNKNDRIAFVIRAPRAE